MGAPLASLNRQQKGRLAETIVIATFLSWNFEVFEPEVDDRGIDLIVSPDLEMFYRIQVKGITRGSYTFFTQRQFDAATNGGRTAALTYVAYVRLDAKPVPETFIVPFSAWNGRSPVFVSRRSEERGEISELEHGINYSQKNALLLEPYRADTVLAELSAGKAG
ncbi:hypothetical protein VIN30_04190 [Adlercreutzia sp. R7]|uniref:PD(D/E)XK endonuclease domain-containing protein n=1 Tax=Adlercreutzia wanghongyangiae TaxID=3111451 RepID=A0ABU6IGV7_9ACTN|nr:hypothetical protein [Adlercreutzia sp. R7]